MSLPPDLPKSATDAANRVKAAAHSLQVEIDLAAAHDVEVVIEQVTKLEVGRPFSVPMLVVKTSVHV